MADELGMGLATADVVDSTAASSNSSDFEKQKKPSKKPVQAPSNEELRMREELDEQALIDQKNASNIAAEALINAENENLRILDQLDESKERVKEY